jgi:hypothetical protein
MRTVAHIQRRNTHDFLAHRLVARNLLSLRAAELLRCALENLVAVVLASGTALVVHICVVVGLVVFERRRVVS